MRTMGIAVAALLLAGCGFPGLPPSQAIADYEQDVLGIVDRPLDESLKNFERGAAFCLHGGYRGAGLHTLSVWAHDSTPLRTIFIIGTKGQNAAFVVTLADWSGKTAYKVQRPPSMGDSAYAIRNMTTSFVKGEHLEDCDRAAGIGEHSPALRPAPAN